MKNFIVFSILILKLNFIINQPTITKTSFDNDGSVTIQWNPNRDTSNKTRYKIEVTDNSAQNSAYEWPGIIINLVLNFSNQLYQFLAQISFVEFDVDDGSSITVANDSSFNCFNELIKDVKYNRVARFHPTNNDGDCILKNTNTTSSNKRQDAQYAVISGN